MKEQIKEVIEMLDDALFGYTKEHRVVIKCRQVISKLRSIIEPLPEHADEWIECNPIEATHICVNGSGCHRISQG